MPAERSSGSSDHGAPLMPQVVSELAFPRGRSLRAIWARATFLVPAVLRHKWLVFQEGRRHGASLRSRVMHDTDKLRPDYLWKWIVRDEVEECDLLHRTRAPHQWEWWTEGGDPAKCRPMSDEARRELVADWCAKQRRHGGTPEEYTRRVLERYLADQQKIHFHPETRVWVEERLRALSSSAP